MDFKLSGENLLEVKCSLLVLGRFEEEPIKGSIKKVDEALGGALSRTSEEEGFRRRRQTGYSRPHE